MTFVLFFSPFAVQFQRYLFFFHASHFFFFWCFYCFTFFKQ